MADDVCLEHISPAGEDDLGLRVGWDALKAHATSAFRNLPFFPPPPPRDRHRRHHRRPPRNDTRCSFSTAGAGSDIPARSRRLVIPGFDAQARIVQRERFQDVMSALPITRE
ncbi:hypothetical protein XA68_16483 [Ophiocordyceps unilateralis]|uniref:Uncharacterized protein n=1 Tax=Ophiocordyceps unilateralis TaxID=268505 RepID=A0A2A9P6D9_OPHUN|nr:hypothetical protein XA68_16483 [Ophiocordyceps unilateralis]